MARWGSQGGGGGCSRGHRARDERGLEGRWPHVLARRAHRIDRSGEGWMVGRVPVAFQIATGDDARSLRPPALLPANEENNRSRDTRCPASATGDDARNRGFAM